MIQIQHVSKTFGRFKALDDETFDVPDGQITGFVGLNGAGKTTSMRIASGVIYPDSGDVLVDGYSVIREKKKASERLAWVPELPIFELDVKAIDYFVYIAGYYGYSTSEARKLGMEMLEKVGLKGVERRKLENYSQGMKRRFALAVCLISNPQNYLFDEVLNGLDAQGIAYFRNLAADLKKEGKAVLFSSHILSEVESLADRVVFIHKGKIVKTMTMDEIRKFATPSLVLRVDKVDNNLIDDLSKFGEPTVNGDKVTVRNFNDDPSRVNSMISSRYKVYEMKLEYSSLEEVFFRIIGVENEAVRV
ncbi:ABC transporter ATP-binding protein [Sulfuracidifex tepidarius]|uniref:Trehalose/maltose import ATP-binding protein MalK n=2 Tax=Sulfuracidifex tepidarius TaxID=1294262 RepID=A0A510E110_9CREN|nr:ABC transporter ATP-binding protein [Sulfuracidifex tepidarius]BBG23427.1 Trehalose/maltose import ATP-binding protein MalK [Sulfuracidifex tepidarius]BBG26179.1 Trehalose/maltose import ATP-binding protein MalK [Sulfuracidifex tepidarius]